MTATNETTNYFDDLGSILCQVRALVNLMGNVGSEHEAVLHDTDSMLNAAWLANNLLARAQEIHAAKMKSPALSCEVTHGA